MKIPQELMSELFPSQTETATWGEWKIAFATFGIEIKSEDQCPYTDDRNTSGKEAASALELCEFEIQDVVVLNSDGEEVDCEEIDVPEAPRIYVPEPAKLKGPTIVKPAPTNGQSVYTDNPSPEKKQSITEWRREFQRYFSYPPTEGDILVTDDGSDIRLDIELTPNKPPFIYTRCFVPMIVLGPVGWFAQRADQNHNYGLRCIMIPRCRDEIIKRKGLAEESVYVRSIRVLKESSSGHSLLCEVEEF